MRVEYYIHDGLELEPSVWPEKFTYRKLSRQETLTLLFDSVQEKRIESDEPLLWKEVRYRCECKPDHVRTEPAGRDKPDSLRCPQCQYQNAMKIVVVNT